MAIQHELRVSKDGSQFVYYIYGTTSGQHIEIPFSEKLSSAIQHLVDLEGMDGPKLVMPPRRIMSSHQ